MAFMPIFFPLRGLLFNSALFPRLAPGANSSEHYVGSRFVVRRLLIHVLFRLSTSSRAGDLVADDEGTGRPWEFAQERDELLRVGEARAFDERVEAAEELGGFERLALDGDLELEDEDGLVGGPPVLVGEGEGVRVGGVVELGRARASALPHREARLAVARVDALALVVRRRVEEFQRGPARGDAFERGGRELEGLGRLFGVGAARSGCAAAPRLCSTWMT